MNSYDYVSESDARKCQYYVRYMERRSRPKKGTHADFDWQSKAGNVSEMCDWINNELDHHFSRHERDINRCVDKMVSSCKDEILPLIEFDWIKNDKRICLWLWHREIGFSQRRGDTFPDHRGRMEALLKHIDTLDQGGDQKKELLNSFKGDWQQNNNTPDPFTHENAETINYLWHYAEKLHNNITRHFSPMTEEDRKLYLTGFYDCVLDTPEKKELFLRKMKNALSSHKHRKKAGEGNINKKFLLSLDNDQKLNDMIKHAGVKRDDFMNRLIMDEYERQKNTSRRS